MYPLVSPTTIDAAAFVTASRTKQPHSILSLAPSVSRFFDDSVCASMCRFMIRFITMTPYISANMSDTMKKYIVASMAAIADASRAPFEFDVMKM